MSEHPPDPRAADVVPPVTGRPPSTGDDVLTRRGARAERGAALCFLAAIAAALGLTVVYWQGGQPQAEGVLLALALGGIGVGIVLWAKHFMPGDEVSEERTPLPSGEEDIAAFTADFQAGGSSLQRRRVLVATAGGACATLGVALLFPIRSLGPRPGRGLKETAFREGDLRLVREDGSPVRPDDLPLDGVVTAWPDGHTDAADAPTLVIRTRPDQDFQPREGREDWTVDGIVAYSKLCTHTGCPVGLYQSESALLLCPCHQSTFDVLRGARPVFGPAARSLPQLPLGVDADGYLIATGDFSDPVGPGFWDRGR
jgi:ubiquinol-cytochrome c reductase iron-sulfur subunit